MNPEQQSEIYSINLRRGNIITNFSIIEAIIVEFILRHYLNEENKITELITDIFEDPFFSFGLKINIFEKIILKHHSEEKELIKKLKGLGVLRNIIAHSGIVASSNSKGQFYFFNNGIYIDPHKKMDQYTALKEKLQPKLEKLATDMGINLHNESVQELQN